MRTDGRIWFTNRELDCIADMLHIAQQELNTTLYSVHLRFPQAAICDLLRAWIEESSDIRDRIEAAK